MATGGATKVDPVAGVGPRLSGPTQKALVFVKHNKPVDFICEVQK